MENKFSCSKCGKLFIHQSSRSRHQKICAAETSTVIEKKKCPNVLWCDRVFSKTSNYKRHLLTCKPKKSHTCEVCNKIFPTVWKLTRHKATHNKEIHHCGICFRTYQRIDKLKLHEEKCQGVNNSIIHDNLHLASFISEDDLFVNPCHLNCDEDDVADDYEDDDYDDDNGEEDCDFDFDVSPTLMEKTENQDVDMNIENDKQDVEIENENADSQDVEIENENIDKHRDVEIEKKNGDNSYVDLCSDNVITLDEAPPTVYILDDENLFNNMHFITTEESPTYSKLSFENAVTDSTIKHLKRLKHEGKRSFVKAKEFAKLCLLLFDKRFDDIIFLNALSKELGYATSDEFLSFINNTNDCPLTIQGRPMAKLKERQHAYDFWKENSDVSNDRRNTRHVVKVIEDKLDLSVKDLKDDRVKLCESKGRKKLKSQRYIYNDTTRELYRKFRIKYPHLKVSYSLFYRCRPFYIFPPSAREMESCLCSKCLNPHALYNTLRRSMNGLPPSLTEYLITYFECDLDFDLNFPKLECIEGSCEKNCFIINETTDEKYEQVWNKKVSFYQFETVEERYHNKEGEERVYNRTARKDYKDVLLKDVYQLFLANATNYLQHRYHTLLDKIYWQQFLENTSSAVIWMDYSQNIKLIEKNQAQSAHFSGKQQTLHDSLILYKEKYQYIYHISDDTNHDSVFTTTIINSIIDNHPEVVETGRLILRSDNCATQYKSRFVFGALLALAKEKKIKIDFFYGEPGHGRGLIDAMAWFGCKGPMRRQIVETDEWFGNAEQMVNFLKEHFREDNSKEYHLVNEADTAIMRRKGREEHRLTGCRSAHVISFYPDGKTVKKCKTVKSFLSEIEDEDINDSNDDISHEIETTWTESISDMDQFNLIDVDSFVAIRSQPGSPELFHLMQVLEKKTADINFADTSGEHSILKGEPYLVCKWFSLQKETRKFAWFVPQSDKVEKALVHIGEIFSTNLSVNSQNQMDINDYRILVCNSI